MHEMYQIMFIITCSFVFLVTLKVVGENQVLYLRILYIKKILRDKAYLKQCLIEKQLIECEHITYFSVGLYTLIPLMERNYYNAKITMGGIIFLLGRGN